MQVTFSMSNLAGRAKTWAYGRRLADPHCFATLDHYKSELREAFVPPKTKFRARAQFLELKQGKRDIHAYTQYSRYLVSCIVSAPVDTSTQVVTYMKGLVDGPIKTFLFREYPRTLEEAISLAIQEDFSLRQAYIHSAAYRPPKGNAHDDRSEPMNLSAADASSTKHPNKRSVKCHRCQKNGHVAYECLAPKPTPRNRSGSKGSPGESRAAGKQQHEQAKNAKGQ
ncbi:hypothetical protein ATCC90586_006262 [Pythium insidiosum]|nr:hypothetical protein ATCC90586_006262 [Pythium insidiosum]